jgi:hypothetical protein
MKAKLYFSLAIFLIFAWASPVMAQLYGQDQNVRGYVRRDGTYVQPHHRTAPDNNRFNNYSTQGNVNPYTGQMGTVNPYSQPMNPMQSNPYGQQQKRSWP